MAEMLPTEEPNPFDELEGVAEIAAFVYKKGGEADLRKVMEMSGSNSPREVLDEAVAELGSMGLRKVARIVAEFAVKCPSGADLVFCDYTRPPHAGSPGNERNIEAWQRSAQQRWRRKSN